MRKHAVFCHRVVLITTVLTCSILQSQDKSARSQDQKTSHCAEIAGEVLQRQDLLTSNVLDVTNSPSCFFEANLGSINPDRVSVWNALESFSGSQQQGSNLSSSGSTNAVSKPSGPTSLAQEFGGVDVSRGTSSTTVQWAPGKMLTNLALYGIEPLCLTDHVPQGCISTGWIRGLTPFTVKVTANTSSGTSSVAGTAANSTSSGTSQQVNVKSQGSSGPNFSGLTVQYSLPFASRSTSSAKSLTTPTPATDEQSLAARSASSSQPAAGSKQNPGSSGNKSADLKYIDREIDSDHQAREALKSCDAKTATIKDWRSQAGPKLTLVIDGGKGTLADVQKEIENEYRILLGRMQASPDCQDAVAHLRDFYEAILEANAYDLLQAESGSKPELAFEYDLNTPQNKPSYSSIKATINWQFSTGNAKTGPTEDTSDFTARQKAVRNFVKKRGAAMLGKARSSGGGPVPKSASSDAKNLAQDAAPPLSLTITGAADIYHSQPSSSIPSASYLRDISAGAEFAYVFSPFGKTTFFGKAFGSWTGALAYSYQDQTSPAILTGPALSDFTGLPSSVTSVYAKRGVIHLGQVRLGLGTGKNMTFPLAFTYSNRSELITHPIWGVQFGITYNLNSLFSSGSGNSGN